MVAPSKAAQFPKWPLPGRCRLGVSSKPAERELICHPTTTQAHTQPRFRDPNTNFANQPKTGSTGGFELEPNSPKAVSNQTSVPSTGYQVLGTGYREQSAPKRESAGRRSISTMLGEPLLDVPKCAGSMVHASKELLGDAMGSGAIDPGRGGA